MKFDEWLEVYDLTLWQRGDKHITMIMEDAWNAARKGYVKLEDIIEMLEKSEAAESYCGMGNTIDEIKKKYLEGE